MRDVWLIDLGEVNVGNQGLTELNTACASSLLSDTCISSEDVLASLVSGSDDGRLEEDQMPPPRRQSLGRLCDHNADPVSRTQ